ncbi:hypothetical protein [Spirochaeta thermophila]|uniref:Lipoprotein n=1 Tax=Winmispira thermophila (strain ATCC 49972 / DSM 6192 / RI 19.B1) TaxID=665571 RepID=E0RNP3_WINT6|nr:hypothetical protein [Spirochaeta thermophila]ADN02634.1 hypothetical protein STHERM_c16980 [Spirochaeta thermophila DSM 6192]
MGSRGKRLLPLLTLGLLLFTSCISEEVNLSLDRDGSGVCGITYTIPRALIETETMEEPPDFEHPDPLLPVPLSREAIEQDLEEHPGLTLRSYNAEETDEHIIVRMELGFSSVEALDAWLARGGQGVRREGNSLIITLYTPEEAEFDEDTRAFIEAFFGEYTVSWQVRVPARLSSWEPGEQVDARTARLVLTVSDIVQNKAPTTWKVSW